MRSLVFRLMHSFTLAPLRIAKYPRYVCRVRGSPTCVGYVWRLLVPGKCPARVQERHLSARRRHIRLSTASSNKLSRPPAHWGATMSRDLLDALDKARDLICTPLALEVLDRSEEHTSELQSRPHLVCRLLLEKKKKNKKKTHHSTKKTQ